MKPALRDLAPRAQRDRKAREDLIVMACVAAGWAAVAVLLLIERLA